MCRTQHTNWEQHVIYWRNDSLKAVFQRFYQHFWIWHLFELAYGLTGEVQLVKGWSLSCTSNLRLIRALLNKPHIRCIWWVNSVPVSAAICSASLSSALYSLRFHYLYLSVYPSIHWYEWIWMAYTPILSCDRRNHFNVVITHLTLIEANAV